MAMMINVPSQPPANEKKRVKVYELRNNDWFDRGTGFCMGQIVGDDSKIFVKSEEQPDRILLETRITKDDGYQKQQETLIVWTDSSGVDMALSFQEAEGCAAIWEFVSQVQHHLQAAAAPEDTLSDDAMEAFPNPVLLPPPELSNVGQIEATVRDASQSQPGRESLSKFLVTEDYVWKLVPLVMMAEGLEDLQDLHSLSSIMKMLILLNDSKIIEQMVSDSHILGVVGALEYDVEFPSHKANHRLYLQNGSRFKEVVPIDDPAIKSKIHTTWRLQYLKDVVLARILDDPTFGVLNTLIFYNQLEIVNYLQSNIRFLQELFGLIDSPDTPAMKKKDVVYFLQQCCAIAKNLQAQARQSLYGNFIQNGLLEVIVFALGREEVPIRIAGTDILVAMIDHDPSMVRSSIVKSTAEKQKPLTETLIELLLVEKDLGVKAQAADAIKVLLDPQQIPPPQESMGRMNEQFLQKYRGNPPMNQQTEHFIQEFYDNGAKKLFQPLKDLEHRETVADLTFNEVSLYCHLVDILMYFVRQHLFRTKFFITSESIPARVRQLLACPQKHMKLAALKFFRTCVGLLDDFYFKELVTNDIFGPILDIVYETLPRDNLLNSACLELFEYIKREDVKPLLTHLVGTYRQRLEDLTYVETFGRIILRYEQLMNGDGEMDQALFQPEETTTPTNRPRVNGTTRWDNGVSDMDADEEHYYNTSDDEDELAAAPPKVLPSMNGYSPVVKPLVDYPDDQDEEAEQLDKFYEKPPDATDEGVKEEPPKQTDMGPTGSVDAGPRPAPERLSEKRRRDDEEDELGKLALTKRRSSSVSSAGSASSANLLRRKKNFTMNKDGASGKKIAISLSVKNPIEAEHGREGGG